MKRHLLLPVAAILATGAMAQAQEVTISSGGEKGAYYGTFGPALKTVLFNNSFTETRVITSKGSVDNINYVIAHPKDIGLTQLDVYALKKKENGEAMKKIQVIRSDIAKECLFAAVKVSDKDRLPNWSTIMKVANRIKIAVPEGSGSASTLDFLQLSNEQLDLAKVVPMSDLAAALDDVSKSRSDIAFFVQFPDPSNAIFKTIAEKGMKIVPVYDESIISTKVDDTSVYTSSTITLGGESLPMACTGLAFITGSKNVVMDLYPDVADRAETRENRRSRTQHNDMVSALKNVSKDEFFNVIGKVDKTRADILRNSKEMSAAEQQSTLKKLGADAAKAWSNFWK